MNPLLSRPCIPTPRRLLIWIDFCIHGKETLGIRWAIWRGYLARPDKIEGPIDVVNGAMRVLVWIDSRKPGSGLMHLDELIPKPTISEEVDN